MMLDTNEIDDDRDQNFHSFLKKPVQTGFMIVFRRLEISRKKHNLMIGLIK